MAKYSDVLQECLCLHLRQAARVITQRLDEGIRGTGLRSTQFTVLVVLAEYGSVPVTRLSEEVVADRTTLTRILDRLEDQGYVTRKESKDDRRSRVVSLTAKGRTAVKRALPKWAKVQKELVTELGGQRTKRLLGDLNKVSH